MVIYMVSLFLLRFTAHSIPRLRLLLLFEPIVQSWVALSGDLSWRLDTGLIVALLRLILVEYFLACLAQIRIGSLQILRLLHLIRTQIISHLNYFIELVRLLSLPLCLCHRGV